MKMVILETDQDFLKSFKNTMNKAHQLIVDNLCNARARRLIEDKNIKCECKECYNVKREAVGFNTRLYPSCFGSFDNYFCYMEAGGDDVIPSCQYNYLL